MKGELVDPLWRRRLQLVIGMVGIIVLALPVLPWKDRCKGLERWPSS
ncbi:hypothetical protein LEMLEM_LOCUS4148 [Lemmus lemmus]